MTNDVRDLKNSMLKAESVLRRLADGKAVSKEEAQDALSAYPTDGMVSLMVRGVR